MGRAQGTDPHRRRRARGWHQHAARGRSLLDREAGRDEQRPHRHLQEVGSRVNPIYIHIHIYILIYMYTFLRKARKARRDEQGPVLTYSASGACICLSIHLSRVHPP